MALETWNELHERLGLQALGYRKVLYCELFCISCGDWRGVLEQEADVYECPSCQQPSKISIICEKAFTRQPTIPWERIEKPFRGSNAQRLLLMESSFDETYRLKPRRFADRHRRKARAVTAAAMVAD